MAFGRKSLPTEQRLKSRIRRTYILYLQKGQNDIFIYTLEELLEIKIHKLLLQGQDSQST